MKLNLIIALNCEAKPIINALNLKKDLTQHVFEVYRNQDKTICLIISGTGKINAAAATTYIALYNETDPQGFLNIGTAGGSFNLGEIFIVDKLQQANLNKTYYPKINFLSNQSSITLETHDVPIKEYSANKIVDMEAYGFYQAAIKFTTQEFIQAIKIISDNSPEIFQQINAEYLIELMRNNSDKILEIINAMSIQLRNETQCN